MLLSISNFKQTTAAPNWQRSVTFGLLGGILSLLFLETALRLKGMETSVKDSPGLWAANRHAATRLEPDDFIFIGASRFQLGLDSERWEQLSGKKTVQLSIDATPVYQLAADLAEDEDVRATILVSTDLSNLRASPNARAAHWISQYHDRYKDVLWPNYEQKILALTQSASVLASNPLPIPELLRLISGERKAGKLYLETRENRDRDADYTLVPQPDFYLARVFRTLGQNVLDKNFQQKVGLDIQTFEELEAAVVSAAEKKFGEVEFQENDFNHVFKPLNLLKRKNRVVLVKMPTSGLVREIENIRYPQADWEKFADTVGVESIDYRNYPALDFNLADGSHLDRSQKIGFTEKLFEIYAAKH